MYKIPLMKFIILLLIVFYPVVSFAAVYKWVDESGRVHYSDTPVKGAEVKQFNNNISSYDSVTVKPYKSDKQTSTKSSSAKKVVMYSTEWCGYCKKARKYFQQKGIPFVEYDIEKNATAKRQYDALGGRGVPVIVFGKQRMNGFSVASFERLYPL